MSLMMGLRWRGEERSGEVMVVGIEKKMGGWRKGGF